MLNKLKLSKKFIIAVSIFSVVILIALFSAVSLEDYYCSKNTLYSQFTEIKPAVEDDYFAVGVIKNTEGGFDEYIVKNFLTDEDIVIPANIAEIRSAQDEGEMRGGVTVRTNGLGEMTEAIFFLPCDAVMREYNAE